MAPARIRPHERTHPGPKEDRLRLTRATKANLSPIFSRSPTRATAPARSSRARLTRSRFPARAADHEGTQNAMWRVSDPAAVAELESRWPRAEPPIADGHHRYETARVYADEIGGEGDHRYVLMFLASPSLPGLLVFPTHRLRAASGTTRSSRKPSATRSCRTSTWRIPGGAARARARRRSARAHGLHGLLPQAGVRADAEGRVDRRPGAGRQARPLPEAGHGRARGAGPEGALGISEDDIGIRSGLGYSKDFADAREAVESGRADAGFFMRATPVDQVREVAELGQSMPPKSTYFYSKVPTGLLFSREDLHPAGG